MAQKYRIQIDTPFHLHMFWQSFLYQMQFDADLGPIQGDFSIGIYTY